MCDNCNATYFPHKTLILILYRFISVQGDQILLLQKLLFVSALQIMPTCYGSKFMNRFMPKPSIVVLSIISCFILNDKSVAAYFQMSRLLAFRNMLAQYLMNYSVIIIIPLGI